MRFVARRTIQEIGLSCRIETTAIDAYVEHLNDRQQ
jgi:tetrahydromethanopterin S-methyltransferase subunit F